MDTKPEQTQINSEKRTTIYNVIILDKSGSMSSITKQAIDGVNETLAAIRSSQLKDPELDNRVTLVSFCGCEMKRLYDMTPIADVRDITKDDYIPCCLTPLYDAIGQTITRVHKATQDQLVAVAVTIITDGYENDSKEFSAMDIKRLIDQYKEEGWMFAYIGADHDVIRVSKQISIDNFMSFEKTPQGTQDMFHREQRSKAKWMSRMKKAMSENEDEEIAREKMRNGSMGYYDEDPT